MTGHTFARANQMVFSIPDNDFGTSKNADNRHVALKGSLSNLRQYTGQRQPLSASIRGAPATSFFAALNVVFFIGVLITGGTDGRAGLLNLIDWGAKFGPLIADGEYWRLALPMFLHVGFFHLLTNLFGLIIFGSMVERIFGARNFVALYLAAGVIGNVASFVAGPNLSVGASGAVFGIFGAFGVYLLLNRRLRSQAPAYFALGLVFGMDRRISQQIFQLTFKNHAAKIFRFRRGPQRGQAN